MAPYGAGGTTVLASWATAQIATEASRPASEHQLSGPQSQQVVVILAAHKPAVRCGAGVTTLTGK